MAEALREFRPVSTSRPAPAAMLEVYEAAAADGAEAIVSIHLSGEMSGTFESAQLAAREGLDPGASPSTAARSGSRPGTPRSPPPTCSTPAGPPRRPPTAARERAAASASLFYVDTLEYLRRGGRIGAAAALFGGALAVKPLLQIADGRVATLEKVRTSARALARLEELAVEAAGDREVDVCVAHLASPDRAGQLTEKLADRLADNLDGREVWCGELGAVLGAHVGPGHARRLRRAPACDARRRRRRAGRVPPERPGFSTDRRPVVPRGRRWFLASSPCAAVAPPPSTRTPSPAGWPC